MSDSESSRSLSRGHDDLKRRRLPGQAFLNNAKNLYNHPIPLLRPSLPQFLPHFLCGVVRRNFIMGCICRSVGLTNSNPQISTNCLNFPFMVYINMYDMIKNDRSVLEKKQAIV